MLKQGCLTVCQGENNGSTSRFHKWQGTEKKQRKKKRRAEEISSDSGTEFVSKQRDMKCDQKLSPRQAELPDIIPKQVKTTNHQKILSLLTIRTVISIGIF